jgi:hypothetical protein
MSSGTTWRPASLTLTTLLLAGGVIGPPLFIAVTALLGATRSGYSVRRNYISQLALGDSGWIQQANFVIFGLLVLGFTFGLRRALALRNGAWEILALRTFGVALILAGTFVTDAANGYPPGVPMDGPRTGEGVVHGVAGGAMFISLATAAFVMALRSTGRPSWRGWPVYSVLTSVIVVVAFVVSQRALPEVAGLVQRTAVLVGWCWLTLLAAYVLRQIPPVASPGSTGDSP